MFAVGFAWFMALIINFAFNFVFIVSKVEAGADLNTKSCLWLVAGECLLFIYRFQYTTKEIKDTHIVTLMVFCYHDYKFFKKL